MLESQNSEALILRRNDWRENDSRVILYTKKFGKLSLVARGAKKFKSKIAGHIEPTNLVNILIIKGKAFDYLGSAIVQNSYLNIKNDLNALYFVGRALFLLDTQVKEEAPDEELFNLLISWLDTVEEKTLNGLNREDGELLYNYFALRLMVLLGYKPELYFCSICHHKITPNNNFFNLRLGGVIDATCLANQQNKYLPNEIFSISTEAIKILRLFSEINFFPKIKIIPELLKELGRFVKLIIDFS